MARSVVAPTLLKDTICTNGELNSGGVERATAGSAAWCSFSVLAMPSEVSASSFDYLLLSIVAASVDPGNTALNGAALEAIGMRVGEKLVERTTQEAMVCFDTAQKAVEYVFGCMWQRLTRRSALCTLVRPGTWEARDSTFRWLTRVSAPHHTTGIVDLPPRGKQKPSPAATAQQQQPAAAASASTAPETTAVAAATKDRVQDVNAPYVALFVGIAKGALANLGYTANVSATVTTSPSVTFTVQIVS